MRKFLAWLFPPKQKEKATDPIIVVSGLPRSGTSMMMSMLEARPLAPEDRQPANCDPERYT